MYVSSVSYRTSHVICDKLALPLITVQHLSSPLLSCRRTHIYTYVRIPSLRAGYDSGRRVLDDSGTQLPRLFNLSINYSSLCTRTYHSLSHLFPLFFLHCKKFILYLKTKKRLTSWKLVGIIMPLITKIPKVVLGM